jgi:hypothetical protein
MFYFRANFCSAMICHASASIDHGNMTSFIDPKLLARSIFGEFDVATTAMPSI